MSGAVKYVQSFGYKTFRGSVGVGVCRVRLFTLSFLSLFFMTFICMVLV